jgi:uncharacterized protein (DUF934 family)
MKHFIKNNQIAETDYSVDGSGKQKLVSLEEFLALDEKSGQAVWLDIDEEVETIADFVADIPVIALNFPVFSDGRAYSSATILRRQLDYKGELRAIGDVRADQLEQMCRCGFDSFELADDQNVERALSNLAGFSHSYQATIDRAPLFSKRSA